MTTFLIDYAIIQKITNHLKRQDKTPVIFILLILAIEAIRLNVDNLNKKTT